jgi:hypothetical protein
VEICGTEISFAELISKQLRSPALSFHQLPSESAGSI